MFGVILDRNMADSLGSFSKSNQCIIELLQKCQAPSIGKLYSAGLLEAVPFAAKKKQSLFKLKLVKV